MRELITSHILKNREKWTHTMLSCLLASKCLDQFPPSYIVQEPLPKIWCCPQWTGTPTSINFIKLFIMSTDQTMSLIPHWDSVSIWMILVSNKLINQSQSKLFNESLTNFNWTVWVKNKCCPEVSSVGTNFSLYPSPWLIQIFPSIYPSTHSLLYPNLQL